MSNMREKISEITQLTDTANKILLEIAQEIQSLEDNPRISRINDKCFVIRSSDLGGNWSPEYHDFKLQYREVAEYISSCGTDSLIARIGRCIDQSTIPGKGIKLHPDVVRKLSELAGGK